MQKANVTTGAETLQKRLLQLRKVENNISELTMNTHFWQRLVLVWIPNSGFVLDQSTHPLHILEASKQFITPIICYLLY